MRIYKIGGTYDMGDISLYWDYDVSAYFNFCYW